MIGTAMKDLIKKYGGKAKSVFSEKPTKAEFDEVFKGSHASSGTSRMEAVKKKAKGRANRNKVIAGTGVTAASLYSLSDKIETKEQAESWFEKNAPDVPEEKRKKFAAKYFGVEY